MGVTLDLLRFLPGRSPAVRTEPSWPKVLWTTARIYTQRKARRYWKPAAATLTGLTVLAGAGLAYTTMYTGPAARPAAAPQVDAAVAPTPSATQADAARQAAPRPAGPGRAKSQAASARRPPAMTAAQARKALIAKLTSTRRLTLTAAARKQLTAGKVDLRVMRSLDALLPAHALAVTSFSGRPGVLLRTVSLDRVDGWAVRAGDRRTVDAVRRFRAMRGALQPATAVVASKGGKSLLVVSYG